MEETKRSKENNPYFSLILPVYNVEAYLKECIDSILSQDFEDYEIILVDDGASDSCPEICDGYAEKYANIKVIHKENGGISSARNAGLEIAKGEYIWWVDADDWIEQGALNQLWEANRDHNSEIVKFRYYRNGESGESRKGSLKAGIYYKGISLNAIVEEAFFQAGSYCLSAWSHIYRRDFILENDLSFVSERLVGSEDYLFNLQALRKLNTIIVLDAYLYHYRLRKGSVSQEYRAGLPGKYTKLYELLREYCAEHGELEIYEGKICYFYAWHLIHGTCMGVEYRFASEENIKESRKNVSKLLTTSQLRYAIKNCDIKSLNWKKRMQLLAMQMRLEPVFYWLYVKKTKIRERKIK